MRHVVAYNPGSDARAVRIRGGFCVIPAGGSKKIPQAILPPDYEKVYAAISFTLAAPLEDGEGDEGSGEDRAVAVGARTSPKDVAAMKKDEVIRFLDELNVDFDKRLGVARLRELAAKHIEGV